MAYQSGDLILDDHYNIFATGNAAGTGDRTVANVNTVWGAPSTANSVTAGYGQTTTVPAVSAGATITATQWSTLLARISSAASHQGTSITSITAPTVGDTITAYSALSANITAIYNNRNNAAASGTTITTNGTNTRTTQWTTSHVVDYTISFASNAALQAFFNAGGLIRITSSRTGGTANNKNTEWSDILTKAGTMYFSGAAAAKTVAGVSYTGFTKIGGSAGGAGSTTNTSLGIQDLTTSFQTAMLQYADTAPYTANYLQLQAKMNSGSFGSAGVAINIRVGYYDAAADDSVPSTQDIVDGTLTTTLNLIAPSTSHLTDVWGTPTITASSSGS